jgi:AraC-like DNA-binding protein
MRDHYDFYLDLDSVPKELDIRIINIGFSHNQPNYSYGYDRREYFILHYIISGCGTYTVNKETYDLKENDGFIVPPDTTVIYRADMKDPWTVYWVGFHGTKAEYYLSRINVRLHRPVFHFSEKPLLIECFEKLYAEIQSQNISFELIVGYFYQLMGFIQKGSVPNQTSYEPVYYYKNALRFIEHNLRLPLTVKDLANDMGLSPSHTYRIIKKECGLSPHELIEKMKMNKACEMLEKTNISIQEISLLLGYEYVSHFFHVFKKVVGTTPGEYRSNPKQTDQTESPYMNSPVRSKP